MPTETQRTPAQLTNRKPYVGARCSFRGTLRGHDGEWLRVGDKGRDNFRLVQVGPDGRPGEFSYLVRAEDFTKTSEVLEEPAIVPEDTSTVGQRGAVIIAAPLRKRLGIREGTLVIQEEYQGGVWIRPARLTPLTPDPNPERPAQAQATLTEFLAGITPETLHEEVDFGPPVGRESL